MHLGKWLAAAAVLSLSVSSVSAKPMGWSCQVDRKTKSGWITKEYLFNYDAEAGKVEVVDAMIHYYKHGFIPAKVKKDDDEKLSFGWVVRADATGGRNATIGFDATIIKATRQFRISSTPLGYDNIDSTRGSCQAAKGPLVLKTK